MEEVVRIYALRHRVGIHFPVMVKSYRISI